MYTNLLGAISYYENTIGVEVEKKKMLMKQFFDEVFNKVNK